MSLIHIRSEKDSDGDWTVCWCGHCDPDGWTTDESEASCADCIRSYLANKLTQAEAILKSMVENHGGKLNSQSIGGLGLWVITQEDWERAREYFLRLKPVKE